MIYPRKNATHATNTTHHRRKVALVAPVAFFWGYNLSRAKIIAASISSPMCCHSVGSGTTDRMRSATQSATHLFVGQFVGVRPYIFRIAESASPLWSSERFAPIIRHTGHSATLQFPDAHVPINAAVSVIAVPFDYDDVPTRVPPRDGQLQTFKVRFHLGDAGFATKDFTTLRPSSNSVVGQRCAQQPLHTCLMTWLFHLRINPQFVLKFNTPAFGKLWYAEPNAIGYAMHSSRSHDAVIGVYDAAGNVIETHEHKGEFKEA
jgi:hypothetical protein